MELENLQTLPRDKPGLDPTPVQSEDQSRERVSAYDLMVVESDDFEGLDQKEKEMHKILEQIQERASSVLQVVHKWEDSDEQFGNLNERAMEVELKEVSVRKQILELEKKEEQPTLAEERVRKIEAFITERLGALAEKESESDLKKILEAIVMRLQNEQVVVAQLNTQEKLLGLLMKENEEVMRDLEARKVEVALLSKSIDEKSCELEMKVKDFELKQISETERTRKEAELVETSFKQLEARENELSLLNDTIKAKSTELEKKEENFHLKQQAESRVIEVKSKFLELKEKKLEEREKELDLKQRGLVVQRETRKRSRLETGDLLMVEEIGDSASSLIPPGKKHKPITDHNHNDEDNEKDFVFTTSLEQRNEGDEGEFEEVVSIDEDPESLMCVVDTEFNDFSKTMHSFEDGQVWALYDSLDYMPRLYGRIKKVHKSLSSLHVKWFEPKDEESELVACGSFKSVEIETIETHLTFSHVMHPIIHDRDLIDVIPRKGETWALYRDWSKSWNNNPEQEHMLPYRYDFVEVVLDIDDYLGVGVAYLGKVDGFVSVYKQAGQHGVVSLMVPREEMRRFSHRVPSVRMNGKEKEGLVPAGSFELDPAAIPSSILKRGGSIRKKVPKTERQSEDCGKTSEVEGQDGSQKEFPIFLD